MVDHSYEQYTDSLLNSVFSNIPVAATNKSVEEEDLLRKLQLQQESIERKLSELIIVNDNQSNHNKVQRVPVKKYKSRAAVVEEEEEDDDEAIGVAAPEAIKHAHKHQDAISPKIIEQLQREQAELHQLQKRKSLFSRKRKPLMDTTAVSAQHTTPSSSFWKPREERPKGWWKGNAAQQSTIPLQPTVATSSYTKKKGNTSLKKKSTIKPKRPMAFKSPASIKKQPKMKKTKNKQHQHQMTEPEPTYTAKYAMPTAATGPFYYQPAPMTHAYGMPLSTPSPNYCMVPPNMWMGGPQPTYQMAQQKKEEESQRPTTIYNPRQAANDRCLLM